MQLLCIFYTKSTCQTSPRELNYTGWPKKVSHHQIIKKLCQIVLKSANEIRFLHQIK